MLEAQVNVGLGYLCEVEAQPLEDLGPGVGAGPQGQHGIGGGDTQRGEEDVAPRVLSSHQVVEAEGKGGVARDDLQAGRALTWARSLLMVAVGLTLAVMRKSQQSNQEEEQGVGKMHLLSAQFCRRKESTQEMPTAEHPTLQRSWARGRAPGC